VDPDRPQYFTTRQAADLLGVTAPTVIKWIDRGRIDAHRTPGGHRRIAAAELHRFTAECGFSVEGAARVVPEGAEPTRVLIIDREQDFGEMVAEYLQLKGAFDVAHAGSAIEAGFYAGSLRPEVLIYDEDTTSIEIGRLVRLLPDTRVVVLTSMRSSNTEALKAEVGADHVVEKPVKLDQLLAIIRAE
jgi:excisionase family DNA binding protein